MAAETVESTTTQKTIIPIIEIKIGERFRKDIGKLAPLAQSIRKIGLLHPVVVDSNYNLIAGYRRIKAVQTLGWTRVPIYIVDLKDLLKGEFHENALRKNFTPSEMVAIKRHFEPEVSMEHPVGRPKENSGNFPELKVGHVRDVLGGFVGVSGKTLEKAEDIVEAAEKEPEKFWSILKKVDDGKISINSGYVQIRRAKQHTNTPKLPTGVYDVIYADPPWSYDSNFLNASSDQHYGVMNVEKICSLPISVADDAVLFLWTTNPMLKDAFRVIESWGFIYKTNLVWVKNSPGLGYYFRGQHELLLLAIRGTMPLPNKTFSSVLNAKLGEHSQKPIELYDIIEEMYPNRKYIELFARSKHDDKWEAWGNEL